MPLESEEKPYHTTETYKNENNGGPLWKIIHDCKPSKEQNTPTYSKDHFNVAEGIHRGSEGHSYKEPPTI